MAWSILKKRRERDKEGEQKFELIVSTNQYIVYWLETLIYLFLCLCNMCKHHLVLKRNKVIIHERKDRWRCFDLLECNGTLTYKAKVA